MSFFFLFFSHSGALTSRPLDVAFVLSITGRAAMVVAVWVTAAAAAATETAVRSDGSRLSRDSAALTQMWRVAGNSTGGGRNNGTVNDGSVRDDCVGDGECERRGWGTVKAIVVAVQGVPLGCGGRDGGGDGGGLVIVSMCRLQRGQRSWRRVWGLLRPAVQTRSLLSCKDMNIKSKR